MVMESLLCNIKFNQSNNNNNNNNHNNNNNNNNRSRLDSTISISNIRCLLLSSNSFSLSRYNSNNLCSNLVSHKSSNKNLSIPL